MGPTASGKTALALELIQYYPFEIISVDSAMIYQEMDIGTAKPTHEEQKIAPHHLIDIINPTESYSAAQFCEDAIELIEAIFERKKLPLLVGGTMMYFNALQTGLSKLPQANEDIRAALLNEAEKKGWSYLHQKLHQIDPISAARIHPHDTQRIQRALEVYELTGKTLSSLWSERKGAEDYQFINLILYPTSRNWLHEKIETRFEQMLAHDFVGEVAQLLQKWHLTCTCPSMKSVGYRQVIQYLAGEYDYDELRQRGMAASRQLAKRQLTWLRHWENGINFKFDIDASLNQQILAEIDEILDNISFF